MTIDLLPLPDRTLPSNLVFLGGRWTDPMPDFAGTVRAARTPTEVWVGAEAPGGPRVQVYDAATGVKTRDYFAGDPDSRSGVVFVPVPEADPVAEGIRAIPARVLLDVAKAGGGFRFTQGDVTQDPLVAPVAGQLTFDGRPYDGLPGVNVGVWAVIDRTETRPGIVEHEFAHAWDQALNLPSLSPAWGAVPVGGWATDYERGSPREHFAEAARRVWDGLWVDPAERDFIEGLP